MAISGLNKQEAITLLQRQGLSTAQQAQVLSSAGLLKTTQMLNASLVEEAVLNSKISGEKAEQVLTELGLIEAKTGNLIATNECTVAEVAQALATKGIVGADAEAILSQLGLAGANTTTSASFAGLTTAIKANTIAMTKWLVTNPVGWCILAVGAIYGLTKAYDALTVSEKEMAEAHEESVEKAKQSISEYEELEQELETIQNTYDDNKQKLEDLYKLRENQTVTQAEEDYLEELEAQNEKLRQQIEYKQSLADIEAQEAEDDAVKALKEKTQNDTSTAHSNNGGLTTEYDKITDSEKINQNTGLINSLTNYLVGFEKVIQGISLSEEEITRYTTQLNEFQNKYNSIKGDSQQADAERELYQNEINLLQSLLNGTLTYEQYEKVTDSKKNRIEELISENEELLKKVEPLNEAIVSTSGENYELKIANDEIISSAKKAVVSFNEYTDSLNETSNALNDLGKNSLTSFTEAFNAETFADSAKALKELAISGQITPEVLESTEEYKTLLKETGLLAEEATSEILNMLTAQEKLSAASKGLNNLSKSYEEFKDIGFVTASTLESLPDVFKNLPSYDIFSQIVGDPQSGVAKIQQAFDNIVKDYLITQDTLTGLLDASESQINSYVANLKQMGVENAQEVVNQIREQLKSESDLFNKAEEEYVNYLNSKSEAQLEFINSSGSYNSQLIAGLGETYKTDYDNWVSLLEKKTEAYNKFVEAIGGSYDENLSIQENMLKNGSNMSANAWANAYTAEAEYKKKKEEADKAYGELKLKYASFKVDPIDFSGSKSNSSSSSSEKSFDWISIATKRADEELDTLNDKISDTYATWEERTQALKDAFDRVTNSIELQNQAATAYMEEANKIQLPKYYKTLIKNGALTAKDVVDSDLADKISEYQTLYEKSIECTKTAEELQRTLDEIATSKQWDLIKNQFSASLDEVDFRISEIQNAIDILEMKGLYADEKYYNDMISLTQNKKATLESEATQLQSILSNMTPGTEAYNTMFSELMDIRTEVSGLEKDIVDFNKTIRDLNWEMFEYLEESINRITDETEYLVGLLENKDLFDKNGNRTNYGDATIGLRAIAYETYKQQAQDYLEEANKLQKELVAGAGKDVLEQYNKMVEAHRDAVNSALDEKNAILDLIEDGYNAQLDALQELIDKKKEQLNAEKNLYDYQKNIKKQTDNISNLEKQQLAYQGDNSEEAMAKAQQLKVQLDDARDELQQTEYEQYLSDTQNMLDTLSTEFETWINERLDNSDMLFEQTIEQISMQGSSITDTLNSIAAENNTMISDSLSGITGSMDNYSFAIQEAIQKNMETTAQLITESNTAVSDSISSSLSITNEVISGAAGSIVSAENGTSSSVLQGASSIISAIGSLGSSLSSSIYSMGSTIASSVSGAISGIKADVSKNANNISSLQNSISSLRSSLDALSSRVSSLQSNSNNSGGGNSGSGNGMNRENLSQASRYYASGTSNAKKGLAWTQEDGQEYIITKDGALLTNLSGGELILNNKASKLLYDFANSPEEFLRNMPSFVPNINLPSLDVPNSFREQKVDMKVGDITISLPNVTNYAEFRNELIKDKDFEKSILTTVNNAAMGKSTISKLKYVK